MKSAEDFITQIAIWLGFDNSGDIFKARCLLMTRHHRSKTLRKDLVRSCHENFEAETAS